MPILKCSASRATPVKVLNYVTNPCKAAKISGLALDEYRDYAEQFRETAALFGKGGSYTGRKYYHLKLSPDLADHVTVEQSHSLAEDLSKELFPGYECVIATHIDSNVIHSHIVVNAVSYEDGRKLHINHQEYAQMKDLADQRAEEQGLTPLHWREAAKEAEQRREKDSIHMSRDEKKQLRRLGAREFARQNRKEYIREAIDAARKSCRDRDEFLLALDKKGISCPRATDRTISFRYEGITIRGDRLGRNYTAEEIYEDLERTVEMFHQR